MSRGESTLAKKSPGKIYYELRGRTSAQDFELFLGELVKKYVISQKVCDVILLRYRGDSQQKTAERLNVDRGEVNVAERRAWSKILKYLADQGKTLDDIEDFVLGTSHSTMQPKAENVKLSTKTQEVITELGGPEELHARILEEMKFDSDFIKLLASVMERLIKEGEYKDIVRDVQKMEVGMPRERAEVLIRNAIDYFTFFPAPNSEPGSELEF